MIDHDIDDVGVIEEQGKSCVGLFTYPVLQAADILLYDSTGKSYALMGNILCMLKVHPNYERIGAILTELLK